MNRIRRALAALVCALAGAAPLAAGAASAASFGTERVAPDIRDFVDGLIALRDQEGLPFAVIDKKRAQIHVFDAAGRLRGTSPVLLGQTRGDRSAPSVGEHTQSGHVPVAERTTPAGRFVAEPGRNLHGEHVVWVDYDAAFAIHRLRAGASAALRAARLASTSPDDKRLSLGCVIVPVKFYLDIVANLLGRGRSIVYVLPEQGVPADVPAHEARADPARLRPTAIDHPG
jgi:hypothetical protein